MSDCLVVDFMSETGSQVSWDDLSDSRCVSPALSCDFDITDTSWADSAMSPGSDITSPEPPSNSSIWARFNSGLSRFTQELGKTSSTQSTSIPSIQVSGDKMAAVPPRDDIIEGAECDTQSEQSDAGFWSISDSFRKFSLGLSQSANVKSYSSEASDGSWDTSKLVAKSHSSNVLDESFGSNSSDDPKSQDVRRAMSLTTENADSAPVNAVTSMLNHSDTGPFTPVTSVDSKSSETEVVAGCELAVAEVAGGQSARDLSPSSPVRLLSKPPLPQRSGTMSPRDASSKPRLTHRRSQSLQHFSPTGSSMMSMTDKTTISTGSSMTPVADKSTVSANVSQLATHSDVAQSATATSPNTQEIFV